MTVQFDNAETALAHIEAYMNGGDELGDVPEADAVAALAYLRQVLAPATDARLAEIEARAEAATGGPWEVHDVDDWMCMCATYITGQNGPDTDLFFRTGEPESPHDQIVAVTLLQTPRVCDHKLSDENSSFIAHARADIPYLLAEVKRLRAPQPVTEPATVAEAETGLKRCPYCGKTAIRVETDKGTYAYCGNNGCAFRMVETTLEKWQSRPLESALRQELAA
jgi:hypothetical protein